MKKHVVIYGTNLAALRAAVNFGKSGYSVLLLNKGRFIGDVPNLLSSSSPRNVYYPSLSVFVSKFPAVEVWHNVELDNVSADKNVVKITLKRKMPFVDERKCIVCQKCVGKGVRYIKRPTGGIFIRDDDTLENADELESLCPVGAINTKEEIVSEQIESDIFLIGTEFEVSKEELEKYGYGTIDNVITLKEAEHLIFGGKTKEEAFSKDDGTLINKVAFVLPYTLENEGYLSNYPFFKLAETPLAFKELHPDMDITVFYNLPNFYGKGNVAILKEAKERGIKIVKTDDIKVEEGPKVNGEDFELVVLGLLEKAPSELKDLSEKLHLRMLDSGYIWTSPDSLKTSVDRVFVVGEAHTAKPAIDSLYDGALVVVESLDYLSPPIKMQPQKMEFPNYDEVDEPNIGLVICRCAAEYHGNKAEELKEREKPYYKDVKIIDYLCTEKGQSELISFIKDNDLHRVVIGACSPRLRQPAIMNTVARAGLDPVYADVAQLKEYGNALDVQERLIAFSRKKVLDRKQWPMPVEDYDNKTIIIGTSTAALSAALSIQRAGFPVLIVSENRIIPETPMQDRLLNKLKDQKDVRMLEKVNIEGLEGYAGHFVLNFSQGESREKTYSEKAGAILFAPSVKVDIGAEDFNDKEHIGIVCGLVKGNITSTSRATCNKALMLVEELLEKGKKVTVGTPVSCINGTNQDKVKLLLKKGLDLEFFDPFSNEESISDALKERGADIVIKIDVNAEDAVKLANKLGFKTDPDGLFTFLDGPYDEVNIRLRIHDLASNGIFVAGYMHKPMTEEEEIKDGEAQAFSILQLVSKGKMTPHPEAGRFVSYTNYRKCAGCALCVNACEYDARYIDPIEKVAKVREILCDGCAACVNACPSGAAQVRSLETKTMLEIINESVK